MRRVRPIGLPKAVRRLSWCLAAAFLAVAVPSTGIGISEAQAESTVPFALLGSSGSDKATPKRKTDEGVDRRWVKHEVVPRERLDDIADRYGVSKRELVRWNKRLRKKQWIYAGQTLRIYARKFPPPRQKVRYVVQFGDTWQKIADRYNVREQDLRYWNKKVPRQFRAGAKLTVYTNPTQAPPGEEGDLEGGEPSIPDFDVRSGGLSVGKPNRGRLVNGVRLPDSDLYTVRDHEKAWGSSHTVEILMESIARFRAQTGYDGDLVVGAISRRGGGRFRPHRSHQSGRDIDLRLPKKSGVGQRDNSTDGIDWRMAWKLIESFAETGEVEYIFLDWSRQRRVYRAAVAAGASKKQLAKLLQYPRKPRSNNGLVRHAKGHVVHIHIRVKCADGNSRCVSY